MLEILVIIAVVRMFVNKAKEKKLNHVLWGFIGAGSYYIPILLMSFLILPQMVYAGIIPVRSEMQLRLTFIGINLVVGVLCCIIAYQILKNTKGNDQTEDLLDSNPTGPAV